MRRLCQSCRASGPLIQDELDWFNSISEPPPATLWRPVGCDSCAGTGYDGRVGVFEIWRISEDARRSILHGADELTLARHALRHGTLPLFRDALNKLLAGVTSMEEILNLSSQSIHSSHGQDMRSGNEP